MPKSRPPYPEEFRRRMVEFVRSGRNPEKEVLYGKATWMDGDAEGRPAMRSPGRPPVRRGVERGFWEIYSAGMSRRLLI